MKPIAVYKKKDQKGGYITLNNEYISQRVTAPNEPLEFIENACNGCNRCVDFCMMDVLVPNPEPGKHPIVLHPDECWYCGSCVMECPLRERGAIKFKWPIKALIRWKRKETGEHFRVGMPNPPPPNLTPPVGGWEIKK
jgi:NAD-dependent dihydropyrimidine dehydrogenase PreA subunit